MKIFVDSSAWIALTDVSSQRHKTARHHYLELIGRKARLFTSNYVLAETYTWLRYKDSHRAALKCHQMISAAAQQGFLRILWVDRTVADQAWQIFAHYDDQVFSIADCTSFVLARQAAVDQVFAFDEDFRTMGFSVRP